MFIMKGEYDYRRDRRDDTWYIFVNYLFGHFLLCCFVHTLLCTGMMMDHYHSNIYSSWSLSLLRAVSKGLSATCLSEW